MRAEYEAIAAAGLILQVDDAWLPALWDRIGIGMGLAAFRAPLRDAHRGAQSRAAQHRRKIACATICAGAVGTARTPTISAWKNIVDLMLKVKAQAYLIEAANARHEHEVRGLGHREIARRVKFSFPASSLIRPTWSSIPELVAQRLQRYAQRVGKENIIAGTDCGFGGRSHPQIAWAKLRSLAEGAALASKALGIQDRGLAGGMLYWAAAPG